MAEGDFPVLVAMDRKASLFDFPLSKILSTSWAISWGFASIAAQNKHKHKKEGKTKECNSLKKG